MDLCVYVPMFFQGWLIGYLIAKNWNHQREIDSLSRMVEYHDRRHWEYHSIYMDMFNDLAKKIEKKND